MTSIYTKDVSSPCFLSDVLGDPVIGHNCELASLCYRPIFHVAPRSGWMNDPNGPFLPPRRISPVSSKPLLPHSLVMHSMWISIWSSRSYQSRWNWWDIVHSCHCVKTNELSHKVSQSPGRHLTHYWHFPCVLLLLTSLRELVCICVHIYQRNNRWCGNLYVDSHFHADSINT